MAVKELSAKKKNSVHMNYFFKKKKKINFALMCSQKINGELPQISRML